MSTKIIECGDYIVCDWCNEDWTDRPETGGFLFQSKATCPTCAPKIMAGIRQYREEHLIRGTCPPDLSFADWVRRLRYGNSQIKIITKP